MNQRNNINRPTEPSKTINFFLHFFFGWKTNEKKKENNKHRPDWPILKIVCVYLRIGNTFRKYFLCFESRMTLFSLCVCFVFFSFLNFRWVGAFLKSATVLCFRLALQLLLVILRGFVILIEFYINSIFASRQIAGKSGKNMLDRFLCQTIQAFLLDRQSGDPLLMVGALDDQ